MTKEVRSRWRSAIVLSICVHIAIVAAISLIPQRVQRVIEKEPAMSVRLVTLPGQRGTDGGSAGNGGGLKQKTTAQSATQPKKSQAKPQTQDTKKPVKATRMDKPKETPKPVNEPVKAEAPKETTTVENGLEEAAASLCAVKGAGGKGEGIGGGYGYSIVDVGGLEVLKKVTPEYPLFSRKRREEGTAVVIARVENGSVTSAGLGRSSGHARLDDSALCAVKGWKFNSTGVIRVRIPFAFRIKG